ncbi:hypothetical protein PPTS312_30940 [Pseudomonas putida]|uniref:Uncharacterized protein n=1 Tax=Pseudomonas putida TaxID=303 RepID=A0A7U6RD49_PSEPU|nr:hypothetical protein PPTS312_30940 [Pseudomonas putida]
MRTAHQLSLRFATDIRRDGPYLPGGLYLDAVYEGCKVLQPWASWANGNIATVGEFTSQAQGLGQRVVLYKRAEQVQIFLLLATSTKPTTAKANNQPAVETGMILF